MIEKKQKKSELAPKCPTRLVLDRVGDKWSIPIIATLGRHGTLRFNHLEQQIGVISQKVLSVALKTLEVDGLVDRKVYAEIPPRVEYSLTPLGKSLQLALSDLTTWANENVPAIQASRASRGLGDTSNA